MPGTQKRSFVFLLQCPGDSKMLSIHFSDAISSEPLPFSWEGERVERDVLQCHILPGSFGGSLDWVSALTYRDLKRRWVGL